MGLVAAERADTLHLTPSRSVLTVYIPTTPNPTSGYLVMVSSEEVIDVDSSTEEASAFIMSFGIVGKHRPRQSSFPVTPPRPRPAGAWSEPACSSMPPDFQPLSADPIDASLHSRLHLLK
jgi:uncharacterized membrane protein